MALPDGLPSGQQKERMVRSMFDAIAPRYDLMNRIMTFGMDTGWRRRAAATLHLPPDSFVVDLACGTGDFCRALEAMGHRVLGVDISAGMLAEADVNSALVLADILSLPLPDASADGVTCGFALRNVVSLEGLFDEMARILRPGGRFALLETAEPPGRVARAGHRVFFHKLVPFVGGLVSDRAAYSYLPRSSAYLPPPEEMLRMLAGRGFAALDRRTLVMGAAQIVSGVRA